MHVSTILLLYVSLTFVHIYIYIYSPQHIQAGVYILKGLKKGGVLVQNPLLGEKIIGVESLGIISRMCYGADANYMQGAALDNWEIVEKSKNATKRARASEESFLQAKASEDEAAAREASTVNISSIYISSII